LAKYRSLALNERGVHIMNARRGRHGRHGGHWANIGDLGVIERKWRHLHPSSTFLFRQSDLPSLFRLNPLWMDYHVFKGNLKAERRPSGRLQR